MYKNIQKHFSYKQAKSSSGKTSIHKSLNILVGVFLCLLCSCGPEKIPEVRIVLIDAIPNTNGRIDPAFESKFVFFYIFRGDSIEDGMMADKISLIRLDDPNFVDLPLNISGSVIKRIFATRNPVKIAQDRKEAIIPVITKSKKLFAETDKSLKQRLDALFKFIGNNKKSDFFFLSDDTLTNTIKVGLTTFPVYHDTLAVGNAIEKKLLVSNQQSPDQKPVSQLTSVVVIFLPMELKRVDSVYVTNKKLADTINVTTELVIIKDLLSIETNVSTPDSIRWQVVKAAKDLKVTPESELGIYPKVTITRKNAVSKGTFTLMVTPYYKDATSVQKEFIYTILPQKATPPQPKVDPVKPVKTIKPTPKETKVPPVAKQVTPPQTKSATPKEKPTPVQQTTTPGPCPPPSDIANMNKDRMIIIEDFKELLYQIQTTKDQNLLSDYIKKADQTINKIPNVTIEYPGKQLTDFLGVLGSAGLKQKYDVNEIKDKCGVIIGIKITSN